jgi:hypothetical protein
MYEADNQQPTLNLVIVVQRQETLTTPKVSYSSLAEIKQH